MMNSAEDPLPPPQGQSDASAPAPCWPPFGLTPQQAAWLAYKIGELIYTSGEVSSGRDVLRKLRARWDQMGLPVETWADFERAILSGKHAFSLGIQTTQRRAIHALAGDCPIGPLERITS